MVMKRCTVSLFALILVLADIGSADAQRPREMTPDYVFVIDVSGSMVGRGPGNPANIFPGVKGAVERFVSNVDLGSNVVLVPFADGVKGFESIPIRREADRTRAIAKIRSLEATGNETHVYGAIQDAFSRYSALRDRESSRENRMVWLLVYTDGRDNGPQRLTMAEIIRTFQLNRQEYDYLYYATLGSPLPEADIRAIEESGVATYVDNPRGEVAPLWIVYPRYPLLDFGNLSESTREPAVQSFEMVGSGAFPAGFRMEASASFGGVGDATQVEVDPYRIPAEREVPLRLKLVNGRPPNGHFEGTIHFEPVRQPNVVVFPKEVRARFDYGPSPGVRLLAGRLALGETRPHSQDPGDRIARGTIALAPNTEARTRGGRFVAVLAADPQNPDSFPQGAVRLNGRTRDVDTVDIQRVRSLSLEVNTTGLQPGTYRGTLELEDGSVKVNGRKTIPWEMEVRSPPIPLWVWALAAAVAGLLAWWIIMQRRPRLRGRLIVQEPVERLNTSFTLNGLRELRLNRDGQPATDGAQLRIVAEGVGRNARPKVFKIVDGVYVRKARDGEDLAFQSAVLEHGDELVWEGHRLIYTRN